MVANIIINLLGITCFIFIVGATIMEEREGVFQEVLEKKCGSCGISYISNHYCFVEKKTVNFNTAETNVNSVLYKEV